MPSAYMTTGSSAIAPYRLMYTNKLALSICLPKDERSSFAQIERAETAYAWIDACDQVKPPRTGYRYHALHPAIKLIGLQQQPKVPDRRPQTHSTSWNPSPCRNQEG